MYKNSDLTPSLTATQTATSTQFPLTTKSLVINQGVYTDTISVTFETNINLPTTTKIFAILFYY